MQTLRFLSISAERRHCMRTRCNALTLQIARGVIDAKLVGANSRSKANEDQIIRGLNPRRLVPQHS